MEAEMRSGRRLGPRARPPSEDVPRQPRDRDEPCAVRDGRDRWPRAARMPLEHVPAGGVRDGLGRRPAASAGLRPSRCAPGRFEGAAGRMRLPLATPAGARLGVPALRESRPCRDPTRPRQRARPGGAREAPRPRDRSGRDRRRKEPPRGRSRASREREDSWHAPPPSPRWRARRRAAAAGRASRRPRSPWRRRRPRDRRAAGRSAPVRQRRLARQCGERSCARLPDRGSERALRVPVAVPGRIGELCRRRRK